jgi:uncharacterized protein (DUF305 family)
MKTTLSILAGFMALTVALSGCSKTSRTTQSSANQPYGTAQVRGSDTGDMQGMAMSGNMSDHMKQCQSMMKEHLGKADAQYDERFIDMMIPHHQGAITMAKDALQKSQHPEIKKMAQNIIDSQQKEIDNLKTWRKKWYGSAASQ